MRKEQKERRKESNLITKTRAVISPCFFMQIMVGLSMLLISKEQFLEEHNKLSPLNLKATLTLLNRFKEEKRPLMKDDSWCLDKLRIPFISWLTAMSKTEEKDEPKSRKKQIFKNYPETHYKS